MTPGEISFLALVIAAFAVFSAVLASVSWRERIWARKSGL